MNPWLQRKLFICTGCGMPYLHDKGYQHVLFQCPERPGARHQASSGAENQQVEVQHGLQGTVQL